MDIPKQIQYWTNGAKDDVETAGLLIDNNKILNGLFFCHLALEKALKAHYVKVFKEIPPRTHNLVFLQEKVELELSNEDIRFLGVIGKYQLEGRYPELLSFIPSESAAKEIFVKTKMILQWLGQKL